MHRPWLQAAPPQPDDVPHRPQMLFRTESSSTKTSRGLDSASRDPYLIQNLWHAKNGWRRGFSLGGLLSLSWPVSAGLLGLLVLVWLRLHNLRQTWQVLLNIETVILQYKLKCLCLIFFPPSCQGKPDWAALRLLKRILLWVLFMLPFDQTFHRVLCCCVACCYGDMSRSLYVLPQV